MSSIGFDWFFCSVLFDWIDWANNQAKKNGVGEFSFFASFKSYDYFSEEMHVLLTVKV